MSTEYEYGLGRLPEFDPRSKQFPIRGLLTAVDRPRSYSWRLGWLGNQLKTSRCVGFAWTGELSAHPVVVPVDDNTPDWIYRRAQDLDEWPGTGYEGTSVIAGAKAVQELGHLKEYRWAFGLDDLILAIGHHGPAVLGINWREAMFRPDQVGFVKVEGGVAGGHAILCYGVSVRGRYFRLANSWGPGWGVNGCCRVSFDDMQKLLDDEGEACIPVRRL